GLQQSVQSKEPADLTAAVAVALTAEGIIQETKWSVHPELGLATMKGNNLIINKAKLPAGLQHLSHIIDEDTK
ncbi:hypothetical protein HK405_008233, partial [Cladochytrium tenue]